MLKHKLLGFFFLFCFSVVKLNAQTTKTSLPLNGLAGVYYNSIKIESKPWVKGKDMPWKVYETATINNLIDFESLKNVATTQYGSDTSKKFQATGFFRTEKQGNRWWIIDPNGYRNIHIAINSLRPGKSEKNEIAFNTQFKNKENWISKTADSLKKYGFNGTGSWSEDAVTINYNQNAKQPLFYAPNLNFMSSYGKIRGGTVQLAGNTGYPNQCIFVFDPEFETFCDEHAKQVTKFVKDKNLFGYFSDNEMPLGSKNLEGYLTLENKLDPGYLAALNWLNLKGSSIEKITDKEREEFAGFVADKYYAIVSKALKKYDTNHLYLGSRLHGESKRTESIIKAAGKYCDVLSINYYGEWSPNPVLIDMWNVKANKPFIITEFYTKGMDAGLENKSGAGFTVRTQKDRGLAYQHFCMNLLISKNCVGWDYFKYQDNDPTEKNVDSSNSDSNKGLLNVNYEYYNSFLKLMKELNDNKYNLISHFEKEADLIKQKEPFDIILAIGQSNMSGRGSIPAEDSGVMNDIFLLNNDGNFEPASQPLNKYSNIRKELKIQGVSPSYSCMLSLHKSLNKPLGLIMNPQGGSSIKLWYGPGKTNYDATVVRIKQAQSRGKIKAIIWNQGSTDCKEAALDNFETYKLNLMEMVKNLRRELNDPELPFICGELSLRPDFINFNDKVIRNIKDYIPFSDFVTAEGTQLLEDNIHYDAKSASILGERYAAKVLQFLQKKN
jgi:hypothetical protein